MAKLDPLLRFTAELINQSKYEAGKTIYLKIDNKDTDKEKVTVVHGWMGRAFAWINCLLGRYGSDKYNLNKIATVFEKQYKDKTFNDYESVVQNTIIDCLKRENVKIGNSGDSEVLKSTIAQISGLALNIDQGSSGQIVDIAKKLITPTSDTTNFENSEVEQANVPEIPSVLEVQSHAFVHNIPDKLQPADPVKDTIAFIISRREEDGFKEAMRMFIKDPGVSSSFSAGKGVEHRVVDLENPLETEDDIKLFFTYLINHYDANGTGPDFSVVSVEGKIGEFIKQSLQNKSLMCMGPGESKEERLSNWKTLINIFDMIDMLKASANDPNKNQLEIRLLELRSLMKIMQAILEDGNFKKEQQSLKDEMEKLWIKMGFSEGEKDHIFSYEQFKNVNNAQFKDYYSDFVKICENMGSFLTDNYLGNADEIIGLFGMYKKELFDHVRT